MWYFLVVQTIDTLINQIGDIRIGQLVSINTFFSGHPAVLHQAGCIQAVADVIISRSCPRSPWLVLNNDLFSPYKY